MRRLVILNPKSRNGTAERLFASQRSEWERRLGQFDLQRTRCAGDATGTVGEVLSTGDYDQILAAGGDGTVNEVFQGYWSEGEVVRDDIPMGIINLGTGGDFHRTVTALCPDYAAALAENRLRLVDAGVVAFGEGSAYPFLNVASAGMAAAMLGSLKASPFQAGAAAYFYHTLKTLLWYRPGPVRVEYLDGEGREGAVETELVNLFVCNGRCSGGGMRWAPEARLDDGLLRLTLITGRRKWPLIRHCRKIYGGRIGELPGAQAIDVKSVRVISRSSIGYETDGEILEIPTGSLSEGRFEIRARVFPLVL